jgi:hypothetical protein
MFDDMSIQGILYIRRYLEKLSLENTFAQLFPPKDVEFLLKSYGRTYHIPYEDYLLNICEIVLTNAIFSAMLENSTLEIKISRRQYSLLENQFKRLGPDNLPSVIRQAINRLIAKLRIADPIMIDYIKQYESEMLARLKNALQNGTLAKLVIATEVSEINSITLDPGKQMDNERFRLLVQQILECSEASEKASIIMANVTSVTDFVDLLKADCLFNEDYSALFKQLGDLELSLLVSIGLCEELRACASLQDAVFGLTVQRIDWENELIMFLQSISTERLKTIESLILI